MASPAAEEEAGGGVSEQPASAGSATATGQTAEVKPKRFRGAVMLSPDRPARDMHQIVEAIVEQLTILPGAEVSLKLEIDAEIPEGLDRSKVRTLVENATTLNFLDKSIT